MMMRTIDIALRVAEIGVSGMFGEANMRWTSHVWKAINLSSAFGDIQRKVLGKLRRWHLVAIIIAISLYTGQGSWEKGVCGD